MDLRGSARHDVQTCRASLKRLTAIRTMTFPALEDYLPELNALDVQQRAQMLAAGRRFANADGCYTGAGSTS